MTKEQITKLRIQQERLKRMQNAADAEALKARRDWERVWLEYVKAMREIGLCAACEKPTSECKCVIIASSDEPTDKSAHWLGELLAIIHGDGGHYQNKHGDEKAVADAIVLIGALRQGVYEKSTVHRFRNAEECGVRGQYSFDHDPHTLACRRSDKSTDNTHCQHNDAYRGVCPDCGRFIGNPSGALSIEPPGDPAQSAWACTRCNSKPCICDQLTNVHS